LETFIAPITYVPLNNDRKAIEMKNKRYKVIQEAKRIWLNFTLHVYEIRIKGYETQYQMDLTKLETKLLNNTTTTTNTTTTITTNGFSLFDHIKEHLNYRTNNLIKDIYIKMSSYRRIILQNHQRSSTTKMTIGVSPEPYIDLMINPFNACAWNHLSLGNVFLSKYILDNNSF
jgi:hypothetical protein